MGQVVGVYCPVVAAAAVMVMVGPLLIGLRLSWQPPVGERPRSADVTHTSISGNSILKAHEGDTAPFNDIPYWLALSPEGQALPYQSLMKKISYKLA